MTLQTFDMKNIIQCLFQCTALLSHNEIFSNPTFAFLRVIKLTTDLYLYSVDCKKAEAHKIGGGPVPAPLTDEEEMVKYWKNFKIQKEKE